MLEIINVTKRYTPKKGVPVVALDNLSVKFPEKGMVFLLGKSGSGKSTLLNVMGGLDNYDSGEIIIKGKSSKNFTQSEFDSYRNTYLGFIFQEYNILNEFTVGANIGLALQLQGKKATDRDINRILEEVDLAGYGSRKPNELSGGQKQRVAIARALVKNPEIILADEPTGALDSKTGLQVFDTLKKLSKDKLVVVVTHDREFAELYGDRVIELKDGKIISDIEKFKAQGQRLNESVNVIDNKIIQIKKGYKLTAKDLELINNYIASQDAIISIDEKSNSDLKKFARIDIDGNREAFKDTDESKIEIPKDKNFRLIKSRLPFKNSFKIGASSLKNKPIRLAFTIFLSVIAFAMFGLTDTMGSYNKYKATETSIIDSNINALAISKTLIREDEEYNYTYETPVNSSDDDLAKLSKQTSIDFKPVYTPLQNSYSVLNFTNTFNEMPSDMLYQSILGGFYETSSSDLANLGFNIIGKLPSNYGQVAVSEYVFSHFKKFGYRHEEVQRTSDQIVDEQTFLALKPKIYLDDRYYEITGIIDTEFDYQHFEALSSPDGNQLVNYMLSEELRETVLYGYHGLAFVKEGFINNELKTKNAGKSIGADLSNGHFSAGLQLSDTYLSFYADKLFKLSQLKQLDKTSYYVQGNKTELGNFEFMADAISYAWNVQNALYNKVKDDETEFRKYAPQWLIDFRFGFVNDLQYKINYIMDNYDESIDNIIIDANWGDNQELQQEIQKYLNSSLEEKANTIYWYMDQMEQNKESEDYTPLFEKTLSELHEEWNETIGKYNYEEYQRVVLDKAIKSGTIMQGIEQIMPTNFMLSASQNLLGYNVYDQSCKLVGIYLIDDENIANTVVVDDTLYKNLDGGVIGNYAFAIAKMPQGSTLTDIIKYTYDSVEDGAKYNLRNGVMSMLNMVNSLIETLSQIFLYVGIGFAVFAALMLTNYIGTSISYKRREIGILRAVGARSSDVFTIFFNESLLIAVINFALATIATGIVVAFLGRMLRTEYNLTITILNFGVRQIALMLGISVVVALIASFIPVYKIAKKRPVDAIKK